MRSVEQWTLSQEMLLSLDLSGSSFTKPALRKSSVSRGNPRNNFKGLKDIPSNEIISSTPFFRCGRKMKRKENPFTHSISIS